MATYPMSAASRLASAVVRAYQIVVSPWLPAACRFEPSCSHYALTALRRFGLLRGGYLSARRLARCHPWHPGGVDPVPQTRRGRP